MSPAKCLTGISADQEIIRNLQHRSGTQKELKNLTSSGRLTAGYTQAKLFLCSPGISLEKYCLSLSLPLCFSPRRRHMHGRPDVTALLETESKVRGEADWVPKYNVPPPTDRFPHVLSCVTTNSPLPPHESALLLFAVPTARSPSCGTEFQYNIL